MNAEEVVDGEKVGVLVGCAGIPEFASDVGNLANRTGSGFSAVDNNL